MKKSQKVRNENSKDENFVDNFCTEAFNLFSSFYSNDFPKEYVDFEKSIENSNEKEENEEKVSIQIVDCRLKVKRIKLNKEINQKKQNLETKIDEISQKLQNSNENIDDRFEQEKANRNSIPLYAMQKEQTSKTSQQKTQHQPMDMKKIIKLQTQRLESSKQRGIDKAIGRKKRMTETIKNV